MHLIKFSTAVLGWLVSTSLAIPVDGNVIEIRDPSKVKYDKYGQDDGNVIEAREPSKVKYDKYGKGESS